MTGFAGLDPLQSVEYEMTIESAFPSVKCSEVR